MDTEYNGTNYYLNNFSGKTIMEVGVDATYHMLCELAERSNNSWVVGDSRVGFGLGCIQWTFERTFNLVEIYRKINGVQDAITQEQAGKAEGLMVLRELRSYKFKNIVDDWRNANSANLSSADAASAAGRDLCQKYLSPEDKTGSIANTRANHAPAIYSAIVG